MTTRSLGRLAKHSLLLTAIVLALPGCDVMVGVGGLGGREVARDQWTRSYPLAAGGLFEIVNVNGAVKAEASDGTAVDVTAERSARATTMEAAKDLLQRVEIREETTDAGVRVVVAPPSGLAGGQTNVEFTVKVPRAAALRLANTNGKITVTGVQGAVDLSVTNGGVVGSGLGGAVNARTTNGGVTIDVDSVAAGGITLRTTNGGVRLTLPSAAKADLRASCVNGGIAVSNLTLQHRTELTRRRLDAALNGGGPAVDLGATNGGISVTGK